MSVPGYRWCKIECWGESALEYEGQPWEDIESLPNWKVVERTWDPASGLYDDTTDVERVIAVVVSEKLADAILTSLVGRQLFDAGVWY